MRTRRRGGGKSRGRRAVGIHRTRVDYMRSCPAVGGHCEDCVLPDADTSLLFSIFSSTSERTMVYYSVTVVLYYGNSSLKCLLYPSTRSCQPEFKSFDLIQTDPILPHTTQHTQQRHAPRPRGDPPLPLNVFSGRAKPCYLASDHPYQSTLFVPLPA
jgi:hypothetical protein